MRIGKVKCGMRIENKEYMKNCRIEGSSIEEFRNSYERKGA